MSWMRRKLIFYQYHYWYWGLNLEFQVSCRSGNWTIEWKQATSFFVFCCCFRGILDSILPELNTDISLVSGQTWEDCIKETFTTFVTARKPSLHLSLVSCVGWVWLDTRLQLCASVKLQIIILWTTPINISTVAPYILNKKRNQWEIIWKCDWPHEEHCFCAGMAIQTVVFFICFLFLVFLIIIPIFHGRNIIVFEIAGKAWWVSSISRSSLCSFWSKTKGNNCLLSFPSLWSVMCQACLGHTDTGDSASACGCQVCFHQKGSWNKRFEKQVHEVSLLYCNVVSWSDDIDIYIYRCMDLIRVSKYFLRVFL